MYRPVSARGKTDFTECADMTVGNGIFTAKLTGPTGKGNGLSGNAHLSEANRIGMGEHFEKLRSGTNVHVHGCEDYPLIDAFTDCPIHPQVVKNLVKNGIMKPTAVQRAVLPITMNEERDLIVQAETGSGKTAAYLIPIICKIEAMKSRIGDNRLKGSAPLAIVITPTRELAGQVAHEARLIAEDMGVSVALSYGQLDMVKCRANIRKGCDILVATPGRLIGHYEERSVDFDNINWVVLDEADQMFDFSLGQFVVPFLKLTKDIDNKLLRLYAFSATFTEGVIAAMARDHLKPGYLVVTGRAAPKDNIKQHFIQVEHNMKRSLLVMTMNKIVKKAQKKTVKGEPVKLPKTIIFVDTKFETNYLAIFLSNLGFPSISFNGDRTQAMREKAIDDFSRGRCAVMVSTNVCARGLNMKDVEYVINYDIPIKCQEMFMHRVGRTGRAGNAGTAYTFFEIGRDEQNVLEIKSMIEDCGMEVPQFIIDCATRREQRPKGLFHDDEED